MGKGCVISLVILSIFIAIAGTLVVLGFTVYKPQEPKIHVDNINLDNMKFAFNVFQIKFDFNVTLTADVTVQNPNKIGFKISDTSATLNYRGVKVGEAPIPSQEIAPKETKKFNVTLTVMTAALLSHPMIFNDVTKNQLPLTVVLDIPGQVEILGIIKVNVHVQTYCDILIDILQKRLASQRCKSTTNI
ncbi:hypothetical protein HN51_066924 [Arachis hypogaea]|nr:uncharacterized protein LOC112740566 [Arachis hypogaea]QHO08312.1 Late embryogenesis abundant protein [Arachis hypogaea]